MLEKLIETVKAHKIATSVSSLGVIALVAIAIIVACVTGRKMTVTLTPAEDGVSTPTITIGEDDITNADSNEYGMGAEGQEIEAPDILTFDEIDAPADIVDEHYDQEAENQADDAEVIREIENEYGGEVGRGYNTTIDLSFISIDSPSAFKNSVIGKCINTDGAYGSQCYDLFDAYMQVYAERRATTCGTGAAKGMIQDGCWQKNAGSQYEMVWNKEDLRAGDWIITSGGTYGHVCMAMGKYNNGYITCLGENQGGASCPGGGAAANIVNLNMKTFAGAFRPKIYNEPAPTPTPTPTPKPTPTPSPSTSDTTVTVKKGDTLGALIRKAGYKGKYLFGDTGVAQCVASGNGIKNRGLIFPGQKIVLHKSCLAGK